MNSTTNWVPGLVVLAVGATSALFFLLTSKRLRTEAPAPETLDDLLARYEGVLAQLKDHQAHVHHLPKEAWERERNRLEQVAASLLRQRADARHAAEKITARAEKRALAAARATGIWARAPWIKGALLGGGAVAFFVALGVTLSENTKTRADGMGMTGVNPAEGAVGEAAASPPVDPKLEQLFGMTQMDPDDADAMNSLAAHLLRLQAFDEARPWVHRALAIDAYSVRARVNAAVLAALDGKESEALVELERLGALYPEAYDARLFAGLLAMDGKDRPRAIKAFEAYLVQAPRTEQPAELREALNEAIRQGPDARPPQP
jgi:tetratricopeptide (TPR) repeat protein